jgi:hypothetical protein
VDLARGAIKDNKKFSQAGRREWQLSGGLARCAECGWAMRCLTSHGGGRRSEGKKISFYYHCSRVSVDYDYKSCPNRKAHRVDRVEPLVWEYVSGVMKDPEGLRADIDRMIELEKGTRGDPGKEAGRWAGKLAEADRKRARYQEMAAGDLITLDELRARLAEIEEGRQVAERELAALRDKEERVGELERDRDTLLDSLEAMAPEVLDSLTPPERHQWYKLLRLRASIRMDGSVEVSWAGAPQETAVCEMATLPRRATL